MTLSSEQYHQKTSYNRNQMTGHSLDWKNQPTVFKIYPGVFPTELPREIEFPETPFFTLLQEDDPEKQNVYQRLSKEDLSRILLLTYSLTAKARHPGGDFYYRSVASAGALYPTEIYLTSRGVEDLDNGLYHFSAAHHGLARLRSGDLAAAVSDAMQMPETRISALTFFFSAIFFRSAWKYRDRSYRYHLLDTGHVIEQLSLAFRALGLPFGLSYDFDDHKVNHLLGLDESKEVCLAIAQIPATSSPQMAETKEIPALSADVKGACSVAQKEIDYPAIREIHSTGIRAVSPTKPAVEMAKEIGITPETWIRIEQPVKRPGSMKFHETVFRRRSRRNFVKDIVPEDCIHALLASLSVTNSENSSTMASYQKFICTGFLIHGVEGFEPGFYLLDPVSASYGLISRTFLTEEIAHICLDQMWLSNAGIHFLFMTNLRNLDQTWGSRGYRYAMMTAGRMGERLYLAAEALGLGCCGIGAFYDDEAAGALGLNNESRLLYLVAVGAVKAKKS